MTSNRRSAWSSIWEHPGPDEGWSWMVVLGLWISGYAAYGMTICTGIIYPAFAHSMDLSPDEASWPFFVVTIATNVTGILAPLLSRFFSIRQISFTSATSLVAGSLICFFSPRSVVILSLFYGIPLGVFIGCYHQSSFIIISHYFQRLRVKAVAIATTSGSVAMLTFSVFAQKMTEHYEYRGAVLLIGAVVAQCVPSTLLFRPRNREHFHDKYFNSESTDTAHEETPKSTPESEDSEVELYKQPKFPNEGSEVNTMEVEKLVETCPSDKPRATASSGIKSENVSNLLSDIIRLLKMVDTPLVVVPDAVMFIAFYYTFLLMVDHANRSDISTGVITASFVVFGTSSLVSRVAIAALAGKDYVSKEGMVKASVLLKLYTCVIYATWTTPVTYLLNAVVIPLSVSGYHAFRLAHITKRFNTKDVPVIMSFSSVLICIFAVISPKLIGVSMALTGDYRALWAFISALLALIVSLLTLDSIVLEKRTISPN